VGGFLVSGLDAMRRTSDFELSCGTDRYPFHVDAARLCRVLLLFASLLTALLAAPARHACALESHTRDGWVAGIGFGFGRAKIQGGEALNRLDTGWEEGTTPRLRIGHMLGKRVMIGYEQFQWFDEQGFGTTALRVSAQTYGAALTFYPGNPAGETGGIYLRAGAGFANARIAVMEDAIGGVDSTHHEDHLDEAGTSFMLGGGYEFRIAKPVALGVDVTAHNHAIGKQYFDEIWFVPVTVGLTWYF
jgi:opacity protein-like surface antigen